MPAYRGTNVSRKLEKATEEDKKQRKRKKKTKQTITRAVTPIGLFEANPGKLAALDQMMAVYLPLCQQYTTLFCTQEASPDKYTDLVFETDLSDRLHRVAIQQAAGIAKSWRTNRQAAYEAYLEDLADYAEAKAKAEAQGRKQPPKRKEPEWREWNLPELRVPVIQANANVVVVEKSEDSTFVSASVFPALPASTDSVALFSARVMIGKSGMDLTWPDTLEVSPVNTHDPLS